MITQSCGVLITNNRTTKVSQVCSFKHVYIYMWSWSLFQTPLKLPIPHRIIIQIKLIGVAHTSGEKSGAEFEAE